MSTIPRDVPGCAEGISVSGMGPIQISGATLAASGALRGVYIVNCALGVFLPVDGTFSAQTVASSGPAPA